jgi:hypothetical protein
MVITTADQMLILTIKNQSWFFMKPRFILSATWPSPFMTVLVEAKSNRTGAVNPCSKWQQREALRRVGGFNDWPESWRRWRSCPSAAGWGGRSMIGQKAGEGGGAVPQQQVGMAGLHDVPLFHDDHPAPARLY